MVDEAAKPEAAAPVIYLADLAEACRYRPQPPLSGAGTFPAYWNSRQGLFHAWHSPTRSWINLSDGPLSHTDDLSLARNYGRGRLFDRQESEGGSLIPLPEGVPPFSIFVIERFYDGIDIVGDLVRNDMRRPPERRKGPTRKALRVFAAAVQQGGESV